MPSTLELDASTEPLDITVYRKTKVISGFSLGLKLKRPRAPYCERSWCPGNRAYLANKGATVEPTLYKPRPGDRVVLHKYTLSSLLLNWLHSLLSAGFYHRWYVRSLWPIARKLIPLLSGHPEFAAYRYPSRFQRPNYETIETDVLIVGGGIAGLAAAVAAGSSGAKVILVDTFDKLGGFMAHYTGETRIDETRGDELVLKLVDEAARSGVKLFRNTRYIGRFEEGHVITGNGRLGLVKAKSIIFAGGGVSPPPIFENNDLPGIVSLSYALRLFNTYKAKASRIAVLGDSGWAVRAAMHFQKIIGDVHLIYSSSPSEETRKLIDEAVALGVKVHASRIRKALGREHVSGLLLENGERLNVKIVVSALTPHPDVNPPLQSGLELDYNVGLGRFMIKNTLTEASNGLFVAGTVAGTYWEDQALHQGFLAGYKAARYSGYRVDDETIKIAEDDFKQTLISSPASTIYESGLASIVDKTDIWFSGRIAGLQFVDFEMDVTLEDIVKSYEAGYKNLEKLKRYTALGTGAEQGRLSAQTAAILLSHIKKTPLNELGLFRSRPPHEMPSLGDLAVVEV